MAASQVLYDAAGATLPDQQGWLSKGMAGVSETLIAGPAVQVSPLIGNSAYGGYSNHFANFTGGPDLVATGGMVNGSFPSLDRNAGYTLTLGFQVLSESHASADRGGFSITLIGSDKTGIAIGFQNDRIFAHNGDATLTAGERIASSDGVAASALVGRAFASNLWQISVIGSTYSLTQGGDTILTGALRDYGTGGYVGPGNTAYKTADFVFFGDNTSSAQATFSINYAAITAAPVPEPTTYGMMMAGLMLVGAVAFRRRPQPA